MEKLTLTFILFLIIGAGLAYYFITNWKSYKELCRVAQEALDTGADPRTAVLNAVEKNNKERQAKKAYKIESSNWREIQRILESDKKIRQGYALNRSPTGDPALKVISNIQELIRQEITDSLVAKVFEEDAKLLIALNDQLPGNGKMVTVDLDEEAPLSPLGYLAHDPSLSEEQLLAIAEISDLLAAHFFKQ